MKSSFHKFFCALRFKRKTSKYKEIFSTTENKLNLHNTSPLTLPDDPLNVKIPAVKSFLQDEFFDKSRTSEFLSEEISDFYQTFNENYNEQSAENIKAKLKKEIKFLKIKLSLLALFLSLSLTFDSFLQINPAWLNAIFSNVPRLYLVASSYIFILSCIVGFKVIKSAVVHLAYAVLALDTAIILPLISTFFCCSTSLIYSFLTASFQASSFVSLFVFDFILIVLNLFISKKRILKNLKFVASSKPKYNVDMYALNDIATSINPKKKLFTAYQHKTNSLTNFIRNSYKESFSEFIISKIIPFSIIFSVACGIFNFVFTKNLVSALTAVNVASLMSFPFAAPCVCNFIISAVCKYALRIRTMIVGENAIRKFAKVKCIVLNDSDLYPPKNVVLRGIKTFNGQRIDEAILFAAALVCHINAPISQVFDKIIMGKRTLLTKASDVVFKEEKGVVGWVNGKRVLIGNRELLKDFKISSPSRDYEKKYRIPNCELTYFAIGRELVAMFILEYTPSKSICNALASCAKNNMKIFVKTVDSNLTLQKISCDFNLNKKFLSLLSYDNSQQITELHNKTEDNSNAFFATFGSCSAFIKSISMCCFANNNIMLVSAIQLLQLLLNVFLIAYLIFCSSLSELHTLELTIYSLLWFVFTSIAAKLKRIKY